MNHAVSHYAPMEKTGVNLRKRLGTNGIHWRVQGENQCQPKTAILGRYSVHPWHKSWTCCKIWQWLCGVLGLLCCFGIWETFCNTRNHGFCSLQENVQLSFHALKLKCIQIMQQDNNIRIIGNKPVNVNHSAWSAVWTCVRLSGWHL